MLDPFPGQELLDRDQVRRLVGMERTTFGRWLHTEAARLFPLAVEVGRTPRGRPILKWRKSQVLAWIELLRPPESGTVQPKPAQTGPNRPKSEG